MLPKILILFVAILTTSVTSAVGKDEALTAKKVVNLVQQIKSTSKTGELLDGLRIRLQADLIKIADEDGPAKTHKEYWEFTAKKLIRLEPKGKNWIKKEVKDYDPKQLANILLKSQFQTIGLSEDKGRSTLFAKTEFDLGHRSIDFIEDNKSTLYLEEACVGISFSPKDSKRFAQLYDDLIEFARTK